MAEIWTNEDEADAFEARAREMRDRHFRVLRTWKMFGPKGETPQGGQKLIAEGSFDDVVNIGAVLILEGAHNDEDLELFCLD